MNTVHQLFSNYGWKQIDNTINDNTKFIFIKNNETRLDEFIIETTTSDNSFEVTVPIKNSDISYKNTINDIEHLKTYLEMHLHNMDY